jgi:hypothetical protein
VDGERVWTTRHEGVPIAHPSASLLIGRRHGEHWPTAVGRDWRPGAGDPTCLRGHACLFAAYRRALPPATIQSHYQGLVRLMAAATSAAALASTAAIARLPQKAPGTQAVVVGGTCKSATLTPATVKAGTAVSTSAQAGFGGGILALITPQAQVKAPAANEERKGRGVLEARAARASASRHSPLVWGRGAAPTMPDVDAFYAGLEGNPVWRLTRRSLTRPTFAAAAAAREAAHSSRLAALGSDHNVAASTSAKCSEDSCGSGILSAAPPGSALGTRLEEAHSRAADALLLFSDPGKQGHFMRTSLHALIALPRHLAFAGRWDMLSQVLGAPTFLGRLIQEFGPGRAAATLAEAAAAAGAAAEEGAGGHAAAAARDSLELLWVLVSAHVRDDSTTGHGTGGGGGGGGLAGLWSHALSAALPGAERAANILGDLLADSRRLLAQDAAASGNGIGEVSKDGTKSAAGCLRRIELERALQRLLAAARLDLTVLVGGGDGALQATAAEIEARLEDLAEHGDDEEDYQGTGGDEGHARQEEAALLQTLVAAEAKGRGRAMGASAAGGGSWVSGKDAAVVAAATAAEDLALLLCLMERDKKATKKVAIRIFMRKPYPPDERALEALRARLLIRARPAVQGPFFSAYVTRIEPWLLAAPAHAPSLSGDEDEGDGGTLAVLCCRFGIPQLHWDGEVGQSFGNMSILHYLFRRLA